MTDVPETNSSGYYLTSQPPEPPRVFVTSGVYSDGAYSYMYEASVSIVRERRHDSAHPSDPYSFAGVHFADPQARMVGARTLEG